MSNLISIRFSVSMTGSGNGLAGPSGRGTTLLQTPVNGS
jgi:hypothetical protein